MMLCIMALVLEVIPFADHYAFTQEESLPAVLGDRPESMDFRACVKLALEQSPYFTENALEIEIRRLDESDSRWSFIPSVSMFTSRTVGLKKLDQYGNEENADDYTLNFSVHEYDPFKNYFTLKARKIITDITILSYQKRIENGIYDMAQKFLECETFDQLLACQEKEVLRYREKVDFFRERHKSGAETQMEVRLAQQQLLVAEAESEHISAQKSTVMEELRQFLGLEFPQRLDVNLQRIKQQVLGDLKAAAVELKQAQDHSFELKINELKNKLQGYRIYQAYAEFVPKVSMGINKTTDLNAVQPGEYYANIVTKMNLWNGFSDVNDVTRQKKILKQYKNETRLAENSLNARWQTAKQVLKETETALKLAHLKEEMAEVKERQSEILYDANKQSLSTLLDQRISRITAQKGMILKVQDHNRKILAIRYLSGDLFNTFINVAPWKE